MKYIKYLIVVLVLFAGQIMAQETDTLESGSSDSIKVITVDRPARLIMVAMKQLDTNATSPDEVTFYVNVDKITAPVDFNLSSGDSLKSPLTFTYSSAGQLRIGWIWLPNATSLWIRMSNSTYLTNRKILYEVTITYY